MKGCGWDSGNIRGSPETSWLAGNGSDLVRAEDQMEGKEVETQGVDTLLKAAEGDSVLGGRWRGVCSQESRVNSVHSNARWQEPVERTLTVQKWKETSVA